MTLQTESSQSESWLFEAGHNQPLCYIDYSRIYFEETYYHYYSDTSDAIWKVTSILKIRASHVHLLRWVFTLHLFNGYNVLMLDQSRKQCPSWFNASARLYIFTLKIIFLANMTMDSHVCLESLRQSIVIDMSNLADLSGAYEVTISQIRKKMHILTLGPSNLITKYHPLKLVFSTTRNIQWLNNTLQV